MTERHTAGTTERWRWDSVWSPERMDTSDHSRTIGIFISTLMTLSKLTPTRCVGLFPSFFLCLILCYNSWCWDMPLLSRWHRSTLAAWLKTIIKMLFTGILKLSVKCIFIKTSKLNCLRVNIVYMYSTGTPPLYMSNNLSRSIAKELQPHK